MGASLKTRTRWLWLGHKGAIPISGAFPVQGTLRDWLEPNYPSISKAATRSASHSPLWACRLLPSPIHDRWLHPRKGQAAALTIPVGGPQHGNNVELWKAQKTLWELYEDGNRTLFGKNEVFPSVLRGGGPAWEC